MSAQTAKTNRKFTKRDPSHYETTLQVRNDHVWSLYGTLTIYDNDARGGIYYFQKLFETISSCGVPLKNLKLIEFLVCFGWYRYNVHMYASENNKISSVVVNDNYAFNRICMLLQRNQYALNNIIMRLFESFACCSRIFHRTCPFLMMASR